MMRQPARAWRISRAWPARRNRVAAPRGASSTPDNSREALCARTHMETVDILRSLNFGERVAEEEGALENYFVETNQWAKIAQGQVDIIYGPKGSGKSALYYLLLKKQAELKRRGIELIAGENPRGETAFRALVADPPTSER